MRVLTDTELWNPRAEPSDNHLLLLDDGTLHPLTAKGTFALQRLRLNRPPLVTYRTRRRRQADEARLLQRYRDVVALLEQLHQQHAALLEEHRTLLEKQWTLLRTLIGIED